MLPSPLALRIGNELYLFVFLCAGLFTYAPRVVIWTDLAATVVWSAGTLWIFLLPGSLGEVPAEVWRALPHDEQIAAAIDPRRVFAAGGVGTSFSFWSSRRSWRRSFAGTGAC